MYRFTYLGPWAGRRLGVIQTDTIRTITQLRWIWEWAEKLEPNERIVLEREHWGFT